MLLWQVYFAEVCVSRNACYHFDGFVATKGTNYILLLEYWMPKAVLGDH